LVNNVRIGGLGSGDERPFMSIFSALKTPLNAGFIRKGGFFSVVILSDEDDFSVPGRVESDWHRGGGPDHDYTNRGLMPTNLVVAGLDQLTDSTPANRNYSVSAITVLDAACQAEHVVDSPSTIIGKRYIELVNQTGGVLGSICDKSFANSLNFIQNRISELSTQFKLGKIPQQKTIRIHIDGVKVPNDLTNGWTYNEASNSIVFHGKYIPKASSAVQVAFDPLFL
jgi:hypothetical protein